MVHRYVGARRIHQARPSMLLILVTWVVASLAACGTASVAGSTTPSTTTTDHRDGAGPTPEDMVEHARTLPGVDDVGLVYVDPDGAEHDAAPDTADRADWTARITIGHDLRRGEAWATETVASLTRDWPASPPSSPNLEIWLAPAAGAEVSALAYPEAPNGRDLVSDAYLMAATPGVVRAVFGGQTTDVLVRDASDLAKVADVAAAVGMDVEVVRTADGSSSLEVASVPPRPRLVVPERWPEDPAAPGCSPDDLLLSIAGHDAATGHRAMLVAGTNVSDTPCAIEGYPEIAFRTLDEQSLGVTVTHGSSFMARDPGARRVVVPVGARVLSVAGWNAMSTAEAPEGSGNWPDVTAEILLAVEPGAEPQELPLTSWVLPPQQQAEAVSLGGWPITTLDILDGAEVEMTAWAPGHTTF